MLEGVAPEIIDREMILDGTNKHFRPTKLRYFTDSMVIDEIFVYKYNPQHAAWGEISEHYFEEANVTDIHSFREWNISNHPIQKDIKRRLFLVELKINSTEIIVSVIIKHYHSNGYKANIADKTLTKKGADGVTYEHQGMSLTEREYWDVLTVEYGLTPYQLLDERIPEMDSFGVFNTY